MQTIESLIGTIDELEEDPDEQAIRETAAQLQRYDYTPLLLTDVPGFFQYTKADLKQTCHAIMQADADLPAFAGMSQTEGRNKQIKLLIYHYKHLQRLRRGDPDAWDEVTELVGDD